MSVKMRQEVERKIAKAFVTSAISSDYSITVDYGDGPSKKLNSVASVLKTMFQGDDDMLVLYKSGQPSLWIHFVYGNDGWDVISDYSVALEPLLTETEYSFQNLILEETHMAIEKKRGCGFRKVGGLYLVGGGIGIPCDRLPFPLTICPCCGEGIKQAMGWTWVDVAKLFQEPHQQPSFDSTLCLCARKGCPLCGAPETMGRAGLLWIGEKFYKTPDLFVKEGVEMGFSRRIKAIPQGFKVGETWILLAHSKTIYTDGPNGEPELGKYTPGIFYVWLPQRIEKIMLDSQRGSDEVKALEKRGIVPVFVPDHDKDHTKGTAHTDYADAHRRKRDEEEEEE